MIKQFNNQKAKLLCYLNLRTFKKAYKNFKEFKNKINKRKYLLKRNKRNHLKIKQNQYKGTLRNIGNAHQKN